MQRRGCGFGALRSDVQSPMQRVYDRTELFSCVHNDSTARASGHRRMARAKATSGLSIRQHARDYFSPLLQRYVYGEKLMFC